MPIAIPPTLSKPIFSEIEASPDPRVFKIFHPSDNQLYNDIGSLSKKQVVGFAKSRTPDDSLFPLSGALGTQADTVLKSIKSAGKIIFHAAGDTGASNSRKYGNEISVADQLAADCHTANDGNRARFLFHLGDVVYDFGESKYYYDQFYEPFRAYPAPIFAIPGNHDSFVVPPSIPNAPGGEPPLDIFSRNFCNDQFVVTPEAASLHRTSMIQPGVYFTLDAPFVRIIGLFSNALEDPGLISGESGKWPGVPDFQLSFLSAQLSRIKKEKYPGAVILATHHPPFSYSPKTKVGGGNHSSSADMLFEIDTVCKQAGVYPHAFLSGHAHNYQRFARKLTFGGKSIEVPFIISGDGGHNVNALVRSHKGQPAQEPPFGLAVDYLERSKTAVSTQGLTLKHYDDHNYGYLRVTVDKQHLRIGFQQVGKPLMQSRTDFVTVDLATHTVVGN